MRTATLTVAALAAIGAALLSAPAAAADPGCWHPGDADCGGHSWNGPLRQTWDTPGFYGGNNGGDPEICSPFTYQCVAAIPTR
jgi:hypothetical protein